MEIECRLLEYGNEPHYGLVILESDGGFVAYRKTRPLWYWLVMSAVSAIVGWLFLVVL
jgi:hypothetical protein